MENQILMPFEQEDAFEKNKSIRKVWHNEEWYFSIIDVIEILTNSKDPNQYWKKLKSRDPEIIKGVQIVPLSISAGTRKIICSNTEGVFRVVMSVPSPKAEPLKLWLAQVGKERIEEVENPELAYERTREMYKAKGYPEDWIGYREKSIKTRKELTEEWKNRDVKEGQEFSILTATIAKRTFGLTPKEHSEYKGLKKQNLRDHMTSIELIFTALSEESTRLIAINDNAKGFSENHKSAIKGGDYAGKARLELEKEINQPVVSKDNFLGLGITGSSLDETTNG